MAGWQQLTIVGNVGRDPNLRYTQTGIPVCDFSVAVTVRYGGKDGAEKKEDTTWFKVTCWRNQAEIANQYVRKGTQIMVVGTVKVSAYTDKSGQPAASLELTSNTFQLLGSRSSSGDNSTADTDGEYQAPADIGEIPF